MFLTPFYREDGEGIRIEPEQASRFAKEIAGDFNPIHNPDAKRFCVPGDLLFSMVLQRYGLSNRMCFTFSGMVGQDALLHFPKAAEQKFAITDGRGRSCLEVEREGDLSMNDVLLENMARNYVAFSGQNFPHVLMPLLKEQGAMINPDRPLVIYESMSVRLDHLDITDPELAHDVHRAEVNGGKRADVRLAFTIKSNGEQVGRGFKKLLVSGLKPYEPERAERMVDDYMTIMQAYQSG